jgi:hypothetical protein
MTKLISKKHTSKPFMEPKTNPKNRINTVLILFVALNIIGDIGNISFWYASPSSQGSLQGGYIASIAGNDNALIAGSIILAIVSVVYIVGLYGLFKRMLWAPLLVIDISVANRALALVLYEISLAYAFWAVWTVILVVVSVLDYRKLKAATLKPSTQSNP